MTTLGEFEVHPFADEFPLIEGERFDELVASIKRDGLAEPIVITHDGKTLVDGRNRWRACWEAMVDPVFRKLPPHYTERHILDEIARLNVHRRDLTAGQRDFIALSMERRYAEVAKEAESQRKKNQFSPAGTTVAGLPQSSEANKSREKAARAVGASGRGVSQAKAIERDAPDLKEEVVRGRMSIDAADRERKKRIASRPKPEPKPKPSAVMLQLKTHDGQIVEYPKPVKATFNDTPGDGISWARWSWNPVTGCLHGCDYCYAREIATGDRYKSAFPAGFTPLFHHERLNAPKNTAIPAVHKDDPAYRRVFVCSMADLYGRWVPQEWIDQVHSSMLSSPQWQYITLTKFPSRYVGLEMPPGAWVGTSVDEQKRVRIAEEAFANLPDGVVKWLSLEPLREPLEFTDLSMFDWVVIGAQTETRQSGKVVPAFAPPFDWVQRIYAQAREAGCKVHMKPNLMGVPNSEKPGMELPNEYPGE